jgi:N-acetylmuramic acid 6-phosphate (MurNAc-6-P) etherase
MECAQETKLRSFLTQTVRVCAVVAVPYVDIVPGLRSFGELAAKFALNAISTYAHVAIGKVYKNRMIGTPRSLAHSPSAPATR